MSATLNKYNVIHVSNEVLERISKKGEGHSYTVDMDLFYEDHIPVVAYLILKGSGKLVKKRRKDIPLGPGDLIGFLELMGHTPSIYGAQISHDSEVVFLDRSTVLEILEEESDQDLRSILRALLKKVS